jgi:membrane-bound metal-dependent hydrolase YbcI (DUF457 family)
MTKVYDALSAEDRWIVGSMVLTVAGIVSGAVRRDPRAFGITTIAVIGVLLIGSAITRSPRFAWLLLFGLVGGILELWADWVHVVYFQSLVYTHDFGVVLLSSPSYMPLGWWLTIVQFGYLALRLSETWSRRSAIGLVTIVGALLRRGTRNSRFEQEPGITGRVHGCSLILRAGSSSRMPAAHSPSRRSRLCSTTRARGDGPFWRVCLLLEA